jgi:anti-sigma factor RsiW
MDHLTEVQIFDLIGGEAPAGAETHIEACPRCRSARQLWVDRIDALREMSRERLDESELHRLKVLFCQLGPGRTPSQSWIARLVRSSATAPVAARGVASGEILEFGAESHTLMLRVGARGSSSTVSIVGQIAPAQEGRAIGGIFALTPPDGRVRVSDVDQFGEFQLTDVAPGSYRGTWWFEDQMIVVPEVEIGTDDEP